MDAPDPTPWPLDHLALLGQRGAAAIADKADIVTHGELDRMTGALAVALAARVAAGGRVASWVPKSRLACVLPLACARAGLVHVPVNPLLKRAQVAHILADSGAALLIAGAARIASLAAGDATCPIVEDREAAEWLAGEGLPASSADPHDLTAILYTSGSTGRPKGVMLSHANLWLGAIAVARYLKLAADDVVLAALPLSFDYGQNQLLSAWAAGACAVPLDYLLPGDVVKACARHGVTTLAGVPPLWVQLAEATWPAEVAEGLRRLTNTGGRLAVPLGRRLRALFPQADLYSMYGLTEAFRSTFLDPALYDAHPESIGTAIPFAEVLVVADGGVAADGQAGELVHAGPLVAQGYWRDAERTAARFRPAPPGSRYGGLAVWSGDTVVRDADGLLRFVGRNDEMMKSAGNRISPTEIEEAALASGEAREAVAFGVPDARLGQAIRLVVAGPGDDAALAAYLKRELPNFMQPHAIRRVAELPRNANGKLDRTHIAEAFA